MRKLVYLLLASSIFNVRADEDMEHRIDEGFIDGRSKDLIDHQREEEAKRNGRAVRNGLDDVDENSKAKYQQILVNEKSGDWRTYVYQDKLGEIVDDLILTTQDKNVGLFDKHCE